MALVQGVFALIGRSAGKILNTAFAWATVMLFGKVPRGKQIYLSIMAFGSVIWLVVLIGVFFPTVATFLLSFVTLPQWVDRTWVRIVMLFGVVVIPGVVGLVAVKLQEARGAEGRLQVVLKGYPVTLGIAVTLLMLIVVAPIIKVQTLLRRWTSQHVPVIVQPEDYQSVVADVQGALETGGWKTRREKASWMLRTPTKVITSLAGGSLKHLVADQLTALRSDKLEVTLYPADLIINGKESDVVHARGTIVEQLAFSKAYMTWSKEANELEERIDAVWDGLRAKKGAAIQREASEKLRAVAQDIKKTDMPYDEWEVLFRERLLVERGLLELMAGKTSKPAEPSERSTELVPDSRSSIAMPDLRLSAVPLLALAVAGVLMESICGETLSGDATISLAGLWGAKASAGDDRPKRCNTEQRLLALRKML